MVASLWREAHLQVKMLKKTQGFGPILEVTISKNGTRLWREGHLQVKCLKKLIGSNHFLEVQMSRNGCFAVARSTFNCKSKSTKTQGFGPFFGAPMSKN